MQTVKYGWRLQCNFRLHQKMAYVNGYGMCCTYFYGVFAVEMIALVCVCSADSPYGGHMQIAITYKCETSYCSISYAFMCRWFYASF